MENVIAFIKNEKIKNDNCIRDTNDKISSILYQIEEIDNMVIELSKNIDTTYEVFSPNAFDKDNNIIEIEKLNLKKNELEIKKQFLEQSLKELDMRKKEIETALEEMNDIEEQLVSNVHNTKYLIHKEVEKVKNENVINVIRLLEQQIKKDSHYVNENFNKRLHLIENKFDLCENFIDIDSNRARIELEKIKEEVNSLIKKNSVEMFHVKHFEQNGSLMNINKTISEFLKEYKKGISFKIEYQYSGIEKIETNEKCINLIRIIKEAIENAVKFSNGNIININIMVDKLASEEDEESNHIDMRQINFTVNSENKYNVIIQVSDNGDGFTLQDESVLIANDLYGIALMKERVKLLNGTFNIESTLGMGTTVTIVYQTK